jgi:hypothetical protein
MLPFSLPSIPGVDTSKLLLPVYWAEIANTTWDGYLSLRKQYKLHNE